MDNHQHVGGIIWSRIRSKRSPIPSADDLMLDKAWVYDHLDYTRRGVALLVPSQEAQYRYNDALARRLLSLSSVEPDKTECHNPAIRHTRRHNTGR